MKPLFLGIAIATLSIAEAQSAAIPSCTSVRARVCSLDPQFDPRPDPRPGDAYRSPTCENPDNASDAEKDAIQDAFTRLAGAPLLQDDFCKLTNIFVLHDTTLHSWGKWEQSGGGQTFIAIHRSTLTSDILARLNTDLRNLTNASGISYTGTLVGSYNIGTALGIVHALAHEMAHIKWRKDAASFPLGCDRGSFLARSWTNPGDALTRQWTDYIPTPFGARKSTVKTPRNASALNVRDIHNNGVITALAADNPEEDFVETFSMLAVMYASPASTISITSGVLGILTSRI